MPYVRSFIVFVSLVAIVFCSSVKAAEVSAASPAKEAQPQVEQPTDEHPVVVALIAEHTSVQAGGTTRIGVRFDIAEGWHIYAREPGDAGLPTQITWTVPADVTMSELHWPKATRFADAGNITTYGYAGSTLLSSTLTAGSKTGGADAIPIHAKVRWLACRQLCLPGSAELDLTLPLNKALQAPSADAATFD